MNLVKSKSLLVPSNIMIQLEQNKVILQGPLGMIQVNLSTYDKVGDCFFSLKSLKNNQSLLCLSSTQDKNFAFLNSLEAIFKQYFIGLTQGFLVSLECVGVGYKVSVNKNTLEFKLGYSHTSVFVFPEDVEVFLPKPNLICFFGLDKKRLHNLAAQVQNLKIPDAYKGKGLQWKNVKYNLKEGKKK